MEQFGQYPVLFIFVKYTHYLLQYHMILKNNLIRLAIQTLLILLFFYIFNFVTDKKEALANISTKQIVEVFKTPSCGFVMVMFYF